METTVTALVPILIWFLKGWADAFGGRSARTATPGSAVIPARIMVFVILTRPFSTVPRHRGCVGVNRNSARVQSRGRGTERLA
ncbi:hypothetical protein ACWDSJ_35720 [Nocardia sp. NPDC003482]